MNLHKDSLSPCSCHCSRCNETKARRKKAVDVSSKRDDDDEPIGSPANNWDSLQASLIGVARLLLIKHTKTGKINQITTKLPNGHKIRTKSLANGRKIYQHFPLQGPPYVVTQIVIFGLKNIDHLATLSLIRTAS
jgi:hypothetical protein